MADITMCSGNGCNLRNICFRFKAIPNPYRQSRFMTPPVIDGKCDQLWEIDNKKYKKRKLNVNTSKSN